MPRMIVKANMAAAEDEKMTDEEVDELLKGVQIGSCVFFSSLAELLVRISRCS